MSETALVSCKNCKCVGLLQINEERGMIECFWSDNGSKCPDHQNAVFCPNWQEAETEGSSNSKGVQ